MSLINNELQIDEEFKALIPPLSAEERAQLEENLKADGCRDPIVHWRMLIVDGHNRYEICTRLGIPFELVENKSDDREEAMFWIIRNQLGRRNLSPFARTELALKLKPDFAAKAKEKQTAKLKKGGKFICDICGEAFDTPVWHCMDCGHHWPNSDEVCKNCHHEKPVPQISAEREIDTRKQVAAAAHVSHDTVHKVETIVEHAPEEMKEQLRKGETTINKAYNAVRPTAPTRRPAATPPAVAPIRPVAPSKPLSTDPADVTKRLVKRIDDLIATKKHLDIHALRNVWDELKKLAGW